MPTYDFKNEETGETFEKIMSISAKEEYLKENPHIKQILGVNPFVYDMNLKPPSDFQKYIVDSIQQRNPHASKSRKYDIPREF